MLRRPEEGIGSPWSCNYKRFIVSPSEEVLGMQQSLCEISPRS
ncbi:mCG146954 [Mus musculus]|nr:mCG146954 [Mus musculus]